MPRRDRQVLREIPCWVGAPADGQEVDDLNEKPCGPATGFPNDPYELAQSGQESIITDPQQWSAGNVSDAGGLNDDRSGAAACETFIPVEDVLRNEAILARSPRHHRWDPGPLRQRDRTHGDG